MKIEGSRYQNIPVLDYEQKQKGLKASLTLAFFGTELVFAYMHVVPELNRTATSLTTGEQT